MKNESVFASMYIVQIISVSETLNSVYSGKTNFGPQLGFSAPAKLQASLDLLRTYVFLHSLACRLITCIELRVKHFN